MTEDTRIWVAREILAWFDRGQWSEANALNVAGHLSGALRAVLEVIDEQDNGPDAPGVTPS